ncbi:MAG: hypothetical protein COW00_18515 [Bdellovibrio sp. CG12_big_fil_rev_8_21_14_0_65_39_13]|nr:MAG: hypothetical protein COW78_08445 [Bdellovibrio sp. CG22_combo_CG10-13_8_21_14_all_39_27]PIQ57875.1 MAG: hypothetical protein COW00_18515 [Bdellovibrio sp. CG12_big_fil_rev_8_21_14_0_65_39_13]PIR34544.1 MAG: hypothetical protein COV37_12590 [Bdellovibrio sp. CG11_big_fil_rev_8_21_14_0_20_39_38]
MKHLLFIDPLEKLTVKKDSTLLLAHSLKQAGKEVYLLFEKDFYFSNSGLMSFEVYDFESILDSEEMALKSFQLTKNHQTRLDSRATIHMRLDPPFDTRYLRYLWMLKGLEEKYEVKVVNSPAGIMLHNEKLEAYLQKGAVSSFIGSGLEEFRRYIDTLRKKGITEVIIKPLDLYQGIGVNKLSLEDKLKLDTHFHDKTVEYKGPLVVQPFIPEVAEGEIRSIYFKGEELGTILKIPKEGNFLSNIAQGARFQKHELNSKQRTACEKVSKQMSKHGVDWIAFDILGDYIQEINITCPGLLNEVSKAEKLNLAERIIQLL